VSELAIDSPETRHLSEIMVDRDDFRQWVMDELMKSQRKRQKEVGKEFLTRQYQEAFSKTHIASLLEADALASVTARVKQPKQAREQPKSPLKEEQPKEEKKQKTAAAVIKRYVQKAKKKEEFFGRAEKDDEPDEGGEKPHRKKKAV